MTPRSTPRRTAPPARDAGMTLAELVVTIGLLTLIGSLLIATTVLTLRAATVSQVRLADVSQGELGIAAASKVLRTAVAPDQLVDRACATCAVNATAITSATGTQVRFYANLNNTGNGPSLITLRTERDPSDTRVARMVQEIQPPTVQPDGSYSFCSPGTSGCTVNSRVISRGLLYPLRNVFSYYRYDGVPLGSGPLTSTQLKSVASVDVVVTVQTRPGDARHPSRTALARVRLPNVETETEEEPTT